MTIQQKSRDKIYLSISIFCDWAQWHAIILNGIVPFLKKTKEVDGYVLSLSRNRGNHIKLFLITTPSKAKEIAKKTAIHFSQFSLPNQIEKNTSLIPENGIFRDFAPNTVHYGLYDYYKSRHFQEELSVLVVLIFQKHGSETIPGLTEIMIEFFALYRDFSGLDKEKIIAFFENELKNEYKKYTTLAIEKAQTTISENYEENKEEIISFLKNKSWQKVALDADHKQWRIMIVENLKLETDVRTNLIVGLCEVFDFEDRINAYYLFVNALKENTPL